MKKICALVFLLLIAVQSNQVFCYKILGVFPTFAPSHYMVGKSLMKGLAAAGHDVTIVSPFKEKNPIKNYKEVVLTKIMENKPDINLFDINKLPMHKLITMMFDFGTIASNSTLNDVAFQLFLQSNQQFDIIVLEIFMTEALLALGHHFNAPVIGVSTFGASKMTSDLVGAPEIPSYIPNVFTGYSDRMTFFQRLINWIRNSAEDVMDSYIAVPAQQELLKYFPKKDVPTIAQLKKNVSLVLLNNHVTFGFPRPYPPNMIEVGGMHIDRSTQTLPEHLQRFLENAKDGAVFFSMGSNIIFSEMPESKRNDILQSFESFSKMRLIIKSNINLTIPSHKSSDIIVDNWYPQQAILAHPNVKLFITHGGLLSTMESVYFGKPMVGIPVFGDQHLNTRMASFQGYGEGVPYEELNGNNFKNVLEKVLLNPRYAENAQLLSERYRDQIKTPIEIAVYWVEYVAKHKGAYHLQSAAVDLPFYVYYSYDIYLFFVICLILIRFVIKRVYSKVLQQNKYVEKQKRQ